MPNPKPSSMHPGLKSIRELFSRAGVRQLDRVPGRASRITFDDDIYNLSPEDERRLRKLIEFFGAGSMRKYMDRNSAPVRRPRKNIPRDEIYY